MRRPDFPYSEIAASVLPGWEISLAFVTPKVAKALNKKLRGKNYTPNVLSYQAGEKSGEVIICLREAGRQAPEYGMSPRHFVLCLFIHALLHLAGRRHGSTMEKRERTLCKKWSVFPRPYVSTHRHRHRYRHLPGQAGGRRGDRR
ncbi:rRNA maturation RNase YbeY [Candidatus Kaiserbacteria bacterium]|nr:rRNA maturation RNase YbeY [Candidatus Kaiserbacteria bacterium]